MGERTSREQNKGNRLLENNSCIEQKVQIVRIRENRSRRQNGNRTGVFKNMYRRQQKENRSKVSKFGVQEVQNVRRRGDNYNKIKVLEFR